MSGDRHHHDHQGAHHHHGPSESPSLGDGWTSHGEAWAAPQALARDAGAGKVLFFDTFSGVAGDMTLAALLDLGVPLDVFQSALDDLQLAGVGLQVVAARVGAIAATHVRVVVSGPQPARPYAEIRALLQRSRLPSGVLDLSQAMFRRLGEAEAKVHRTPLDAVHFHEVGSADAIVDIVSAAAGLQYLGATVVCGPLPMGHGFVATEHGPLPVPAPATLECLRGVPTVSAPIEGELVTPTGATIVATAATGFTSWPAIVPRHVGWGAGTRRWPDRPNALRLVLGDPIAVAPAAGTHVLIETNVDDMTGELAAHAVSALLEAGALDAWVVPLAMKKGRPGMMISALAPVNAADAVVRAVFGETTTIGVRKTLVTRDERPRRTVTVPTRYGEIAVKVSGGDGLPEQAKPEFDAAVGAAKVHGVPVRTVIEEACRVSADRLRGGG